MRTTTALLGCACLTFTLAGCLSNLGPGEPTPIRYYAADPPPGEALERAEGQRPLPQLRLRRVRAASHLRERTVWRSSEVEYGFHETRRWTEMPATFLERALARELFERHGFRRTERAIGLALDVELEAFEEVLRPRHEARVVLALSLVQTGNEVRLAERFETRVPIGGDDGADTARAIRAALGEVVAQAAQAVVAAIE